VNWPIERPNSLLDLGIADYVRNVADACFHRSAQAPASTTFRTRSSGSLSAFSRRTQRVTRMMSKAWVFLKIVKL
jgi:hypothetical protein